MRNRKPSLLSTALVLFIITCPVYAYYDVIDLSTLGGNESRAYSINDNGQIVGWASNSFGRQRACLFDYTSGINRDLGTLGGTQSAAYSINNHGQIVGQADENPGGIFASLFDPTGGGDNENLGMIGPPIPGSYYGSASFINDNGYIVGQGVLSRPGIPFLNHAIIFNASPFRGIKDLGTLGGSDSYAYSMNNNNKIVGWADYSTGGDIIPPELPYRACLFDPPFGTNNIDLGTLGGDNSIAYSINDEDMIVGRADFVNSVLPFYHACLFDSTGGGNNIDLGTLGGFHSEAFSINNSDQIVGTSFDSSGRYRACLFDSTGQGNNIDLNTFIDPSSGWILMEARSINNSGWIVGSGINPDGETHAFLLTPEPATVLLFGLGGLTILRKRKSS